MPMYEYTCESCKTVFSELRKISERTNPIACPECGGKGTVVFSTFARGGSSTPDACPIKPGSSGNCTSGYG